MFNTNNLWINLIHLRNRLHEGPLDLDVIANRKIVSGQNVVQLETAIGSALEHFSGSVGLVVDRDRFLPVKKTADLLLIQSDLFFLKKGRLIKNPQRTIADLPLIKLGDDFASLEGYLRRIPKVPGLLNLKSLELEGDVSFEGSAILSGEVRIVGRKNEVVIPANALLEDEVIEQ